MNIFAILDKTHTYKGYKEAVQFANSIPEATWNKMSNLLFKNSELKNCERDMRISGLNKDFFQKEQVFYHGENPYRKIKSYTIDETRIWCEEMGDGQYISPSIKVAAFWAGIRGKIYKLKLNTDKIAQVNKKQMNTMVNVISNNVEGFMTNPTGERLNVIMRMLFQRNGYDAAYASRTMGNTFDDAADFFETAIGEKQQQLAIYNNEVLEVLPKNIRERLKYQILQIKSCIKYNISLISYYKTH